MTKVTQKPSSTIHEKTGPSFLYRLGIVFLRYGLIALILVYSQNSGLADKAKSLLGSIQGLYSDSPSASWYTPTGEWNDDAFMAVYECNPEHKYEFEVIRRDPLLMKIKGFLAPGEADHLKAIGAVGMARSTVVAKEKNDFHPGRTSHNSFLKKTQDKVVACVEKRASMITNKPLENIEPLQVVWYRDGEEYKPHFDYFPADADGSDRELLRGGQREITIFAYLNTVDPANGGATTFPDINIDVPAVKNDAAFWYDIDVFSKDDSRTLHGGAPVHNTEKWGLNIWIRQREFN